MVAFGLIGSTAILLAAIALFDRQAMAAALYYLPHTTLTAAFLFLLTDLIMRWRGTEGDAIVCTPPYAGQARLAFLFLAAGVALAGLPPLSGFIGKLLILQATLNTPWWPAIWTLILGTSLIAVIGLARAGSTLFWKRSDGPSQSAGRDSPDMAEAAPCFFLLALLVGLTAAAGPVTAYADATSRQLFDAAAYARAVLPAAQEDAE